MTVVQTGITVTLPANAPGTTDLAYLNQLLKAHLEALNVQLEAVHQIVPVSSQQVHYTISVALAPGQEISMLHPQPLPPLF